MCLLRYIIIFLILFSGSPGLTAQNFAISTDFDRKNGVVEDLIDIHVVKNEIVAVREGVAVHRERLGVHEEVLWKGTRGYVGSVLTNKRLLAVSATIPGWRTQNLRIEEFAESAEHEISISDFLVLAIMPKRVLLFDGLANDWAQMDIPLHDPVLDTVLENFVAAVITDKRVYGVAARRGRFVEERFQANERVESITSRAHSVSIRTNRRLLVFRSRSPFWDTIPLRLN